MKKLIIGFQVSGQIQQQYMLETRIPISNETLVLEKDHLKRVHQISNNEEMYLIIKNISNSKERAKVILNYRRTIIAKRKRNLTYSF